MILTGNICWVYARNSQAHALAELAASEKSLAELTEQLREHRDSSEQAARDTAERAARWDAAA
jgi:hypothetical protein